MKRPSVILIVLFVTLFTCWSCDEDKNDTPQPETTNQTPTDTTKDSTTATPKDTLGTDSTTVTPPTKTAAQIATEELITYCKVNRIKTTAVGATSQYITFDTEAMTVVTDFESFTMSDNTTETYFINSNGELVLPNVIYTITGIFSFSGLKGLIFTTDTPAATTKSFETINESPLW